MSSVLPSVSSQGLTRPSLDQSKRTYPMYPDADVDLFFFSKPSHIRRERRTQAQLEEFDRPGPLRNTTQRPDLSVLTGIPATLTSSSLTPTSPLSVAPLTPGTIRSTHTLPSLTSGPLSTILYREIDPAKLQPFIGPLTKQQPPPNRPLPPLPFPSPIKRRDRHNKSTANMADEDKHSDRELAEKGTKKSMDETAEPRVGDAKGKGLRKKISKFFSGDHQASATADTAVATGFRPLSIDTSRDSKSFSDIFDDVYRAAGGPTTSGRASLVSGNGSIMQASGRASDQFGGGAISVGSSDFLPRQSSQLDSMSAPSRAAPTPPSPSVPIEPPPLIEHPAIRGDFVLQAQLGLFPTKCIPAPGPSLKLPSQNDATLSVSRQRPVQTEMRPLQASQSVSSASTLEATTRPNSVKGEPKTAVAAEDADTEDVDPLPTFDRTVDLTLHRKVRVEGGYAVASIPRPSNRFKHVCGLFTKENATGRPFNRYNRMKRFRYFDLPANVRFEIMRHLTADTHTGKPILLNGRRQAYPAWPEDAFVTLWSVLGPLQAYLWTSPHLRADVMVTLLLTRPFHVIFSPFVKPASSPLATQWLSRYAHMMQDVRVEVDMTKLGFGHSWESTTMTTKLPDIGDLVWAFTDTMLKRDPEANSLGRLTIHCRRYFGYRQGKNPLEGREDAYQYPLRGAPKDDPGYLNICKDGSLFNPGKPWNYNRPAPSLPPSARCPYSGHRRHHADAPGRVPYVHENQLSAAARLRKLVGRVETVRMVGFSEEWSHSTLEALWPENEKVAIPQEEKHFHIDRCTPSRHDYVAPGHALYFDFGIVTGVHRYPPLPDSDPMVCVHFDAENDLYVELGSGKVLTVMENGVEVIARTRGPNIPVLPKAPSPEPYGPPVRRGSPVFVVKPSRIPTPKDRRNISPAMAAMRRGTPTKAAKLLGLPGTNVTDTQMAADTSEAGDDDELATPTRSRTISTVSAKAGDAPAAQAEEDRLGELALQHSRSTGTGAPEPTKLSSKRSFLLLGGPRKTST